MNQLVMLCRFDDVPDGASRGFDPLGAGRDTLFIVRKDNTLHGWYDQCPHEGATPLPYQRHRYLNAKGTRIVCFAHGAQFDMVTGEGLLGPCLGQALKAVPLTIAPDGQVVATVDPAVLVSGCRPDAIQVATRADLA